MSATQTIQIVSITTALIASGGIASFSLFNIPPLKSQPASRSLPQIRWLFSRGSHIFPTAGFLSSTGFAYLCYASLPTSTPWSSLLRHMIKGQPGYYLAASILCISIAPLTSLMIPTNFTLIRKNEELGGSRSAKSAQYRKERGSATRDADQSVNGRDDVSQWTDFSAPQGKTERESGKRDDEEVGVLLDTFWRWNLVRAVAIGVGGVVGLMGALV